MTNFMPATYLKNFLSYTPAAILLLSILFAHSYKPVSTFRIEEKSTPSELYFSGVARPIGVKNIITPAEGIVTGFSASYGQFVQKDQLLFTIKSPALETDFRRTVERYIKAKSAYNYVLFESNGTAELYRLGLISKVEYLNKQEQLKSNQLELWNAELELQKLLSHTHEISSIQIENISTDKMDAIKKVLEQPLSEIKLKAMSQGILLFPNKALGSKENAKNTNTAIAEGDWVQTGQILGVIADTSGLEFEINVNETHFHSVKLGQSALITGNAFGPFKLTGTVVFINHQANNTESGGIPTYQVRIVVPRITEAERQTIQIGMSAEVTLVQQNPPSIEIPVSAIFYKNNQYWVKKIDAQNNIQEVAVETGNTGVDSVQITRGLVAGERIVIPD